MQKTTKEERLKNIVCRGLEQLFDKLDYGQSNVVNKLKMLDMPVSAASLSNIKNGKPVGLAILSQASKGMQSILGVELDMSFDTEIQDFRQQHTPGWEASIVQEKTAITGEALPLRLHADGRVSILQKTAFIADAQKEVVEIGVRLNSFSSYFISQNESAYKVHIISLLRKGVNIRGYLLDPESNEARIYFEDRARVQTFEKDSIGEIKKVLERLRSLCLEFDALHLRGKFEIYLYKHIPYGLFYVVDGALEDGRMMVSPYLYGIRRANCPVMEFTKKDQPVMFRKFLESMQLFIDGAQKII